MCFKRLRKLKNLCKYEPEDFEYIPLGEYSIPGIDYYQLNINPAVDNWGGQEDIIYTPSINYFRDRDNPVVDERGRLDGLDPKEWYAKKLAAEKETEELLEDWNEYFEEHNKEYPAPDLISLTTYLEIEADLKFRQYLKDYNITVEQINDILVLHWDDSFKFSNEGSPDVIADYSEDHWEDLD